MLFSLIADPSHFRAWTTAIGNHFFGVELGLKPVYLCFDDAAATQIGRAIGESVSDFETVAASLIDVDDRDPFLRANVMVGDHFGALVVLAAQVLTATRMGSFTADAATAFWIPFFRDFTGGRVLRDSAKEDLDYLWHQTREHYEKRCRGLLALQSDPKNVPLAGKRHINLPLFQALLRETDRAQIRSWLRDYPGQVELAPSIIFRHLITSASFFNKKLGRTLQDADENEMLASALQTQLAELIASLGVGVEKRVARVQSRLRLVGLYELECMLQRRDAQRWIDVGDPIAYDDLIDGCEDEASGAKWRGDNRVLFLGTLDNNGFGSHRGNVRVGSEAILLFEQDDLEVGQMLRDAKSEGVELSALLGAFRARRLIVSEEDDALLGLFSCRSSTAHAVRLEGGLSEGRVWLSASPPKIVPGPGVTSVRVNGRTYEAIGRAYIRLPVPLPAGHYVIEAHGEREDFDVEDGSELKDSPDADEIVFGVSKTLETCHIERLTARRYLVGAYLGESTS